MQYDWMFLMMAQSMQYFRGSPYENAHSLHHTFMTKSFCYLI